MSTSSFRQPSAPRRLRTMLDVPNADRRAMTRLESEIFVRTTMAQRSNDDFVSDAAGIIAHAGGSSLLLGIFVGRLALAEGRPHFSFTTILLLTCLSETPAQAVMWAHYLVQRTYSHDGIVDNDVLASDFPMGFPTREGSRAVWDDQKWRPGDPDRVENSLDAAWSWRRPRAAATASNAPA